MKSLFDMHVGKVVLHKATQTLIIIAKVDWYKGALDFECLVPQKDEKGRCIFAMRPIQKKQLNF